MNPSERNQGTRESFARVVVGRLIAGRRYGVFCLLLLLLRMGWRFGCGMGKVGVVHVYVGM